MSLTGQVVIVTGGAKGIGRYAAGTFAAEGARLGLADVDASRLEQTAQELRAAGTEVHTVVADVTNEQDVSRMVDEVASHYGQIDVLLNNAGIVPHFNWGLPRWSPIREMDKDFWERVIRTNLGGTFLCTKHVLRHMRPRGAGHIINVYGGAGLTPPGGCAYMVSKDAIKTFTRFVAAEERDANVCIVVISPGAAIATEDAPEEARRRMPGPDFAGSRFVLAAQADMDLSGHLVTLQDGMLAIES